MFTFTSSMAHNWTHVQRRLPSAAQGLYRTRSLIKKAGRSCSKSITSEYSAAVRITWPTMTTRASHMNFLRFELDPGRLFPDYVRSAALLYFSSSTVLTRPPNAG